MRVSPLDIRKQEFTKTFRGYEIEEVNAFLQMLSREWEEMQDEHRRLAEQARGLEDKIRHYERVEEALQEALSTARDSSRKTVENAEERGKLIVSDAERKAAEIRREALTQRDRLKEENSRLSNRQHEIVARLRAFLASEMEMLKRFEGQDLREPGAGAASQNRANPRPAPARPDPGAQQRERKQSQATEDRPQQQAPGEVPPKKSEGRVNVNSFVSPVGVEKIDEKESDEDEADLDWADFGDEQREEDPDTAAEEGKAKQATQEIEKIRRILNDLD